MIAYKNSQCIKKVSVFGSEHQKFELFKIVKVSLDALDRLYRPDRGGFLGTVSNNSFKKDQFLTENRFREFKVFEKWTLEHISGCFLYQTDTKNHN